jgi:hypothetical protein
MRRLLALLLSALPFPFLARDEARAASVEGFTDQLSYPPGATVEFHVSSSSSTFSVEVAREGAKREVVWTRAGIPGTEHPVPEDASAHGCRWPVAFRLPIPDSWRSGYYSVTLRPEKAPGAPTKAQAEAKSQRGQDRSELFFVVLPAHPGRDTTILFQLSTNTYNAYNNWGGYSLYAYNGRDKVQGRRVSFDRPPASQFRTWELPFVAWAEANGHTLDYAVNSDLEFRPGLLDHYKLVLSVGHDEYWSAPMRDHLEAFVARGGNVAFFSGNTCCWQVRTEENGRALVCWKQAFEQDPVYRTDDRRLLSTLWSHHLVNRPENTLTGVGFLFGGYHKSHGQFMDGSGAFTAHRPDHWLLAGTGLKAGDEFGGKDTVVGYECDGCEFVMKDGKPEPTHRDGTPDSFVIVATAPARWHPDDSEWYDRWEKGRTGAAVVGTYTRPGGGTVVTVGTTDWSHGLKGRDPAVERITKNVLDRLSK